MLYLEIGLVLVLTLINGVLAMSELAIASSRPARLRTFVDRGVTGARRALALAMDPGRFLSTVQIGITLVGVLSGAFSGATLGERLSLWFADWGLPLAWAYVFGVGIVVTAITYLSLIVGELVPKQIALRNPEAVACAVAPAMTVLAKISSPVVWVLQRSGKVVLSLMGRDGAKEERVTEEEIKMVVAEAESAGVLEPGERQMISGVMRLGDRPVKSMMTPRADIDMIDLSADIAVNRAAIIRSAYSRFPVHRGNPDEVIGVLWAKDLITSDTEDLGNLVRQAPVIPESLDALDVVHILRRSPVHMGLVHDEYGHFLGIVTPADILESIVGAFATDDGAPEPAIVPRDDGSLIVAGWIHADELAEAIGLKLPESRSYDTAAGMLIHAFEALPAVGDRVDIQQWRFEVLDLDGRRIDKILAMRRSQIVDKPAAGAAPEG